MKLKSNKQSNLPLFNLGEVVCTDGVRSMLEAQKIDFLDIQEMLHRHRSGDWGIVAQDSVIANNEALKKQDSIFSIYCINNKNFWVMTEYDRSTTTVLLPREY